MRTVEIHYLPKQTIVALCGKEAPGHYVEMELEITQIVDAIPYDYDDTNTTWVPCDECYKRHSLVDLDGTVL